MLLANKHLTPVIGLDIHIVTLPPGVPMPLPHPFIGLVLDPMDYVPFIGATVKINFMPRGISDTSGMLAFIAHIPMGGPFIMAPMIAHDSVNFFGSLKVKAEDVALSPAGYMVMSCNDIGIPLSLNPGKKMKPMPSMYLPTSTTIPLPFGKPVMVGGPYAPDLLGILKQLAMSYGFGAIMKVAGKGLKKALTKLNHAIPKNKFTKGLKSTLCKMGFEPVDLVDGRMVYQGTDFEIPGPLPLSWERSWYSDSSYEGPLGYGYHHSYDVALHTCPDEEAIMVILPDGRPAAFPYLIAREESFYNREEKLSLTCKGPHEYRLHDHQKGLFYTLKKTGDGTYRLAHLENIAGHKIQFTYNSFGHLIEILDSANRTVHVRNDRNGRIINISATHRNTEIQLISYSYNQAGDLATITDALGKTTSIRYTNHLMVAKTDRNGQTFYWEYDGPSTGARVIHTWGDGGILEGWIQYGKGKNIVINSLKESSIYYYNEDKLCTQVTDPMGNSIFHEYTDFMEPYRDIDEEGNLTGYTYDERGNLTSIVSPDGAATTFIYDEQDRLILVADPQGATSIKVYNEQGLLVSAEAPDGGLTSFEYNEQGLVEEVRNNKRQTTQLFYDQDLNLREVLLPDGNTATWEYNPWGRCLRSTNPEKQSQYFEYDALGRVKTVKLPDHNILKLEYDAYDDVVHAQDKRHDVHFEYTPLGSLKSRDENGTKVSFKYNTEEQLQAIINEHGEAYRFARNARGEIVSEAGFDGLTRKYLRDRAGKVVKVQRPGNKFTEYEYDGGGRISRAIHSDGSWEMYSYDRAGRLIEAVNENSTVQIIRDSAGRVEKEIQDGYEIKSTYDKLGMRSSVSSSLGADIQLERSIAGFVSGVKATQEDQTWTAKISHNALGQEIERVTGSINSSFSYDEGGRVKEHKVNSRGRTSRHRQYDWNINDKLYRITDVLNNSSKTFDYDGFGNLIRSISSTQETENYFRDEVGNIFAREDKKDRKYSAGGKLIEKEDSKYSYDEEGNLINKSTGEGEWKYEWYGNGMLKKVHRPDEKFVNFEYDALGRRTAKIFSSAFGGSREGVITRWIWDGNTPLHEWKYKAQERPRTVVDEVGFLVKDKPEPTKNLITWIFDEGTFKPAAKVEGGKTYSIINDYLGTPQEAYNEQGEKVWEIELETYGKVKTCKGGSGFVPFRFQGQYEDTETGLYYNRFRYYAPEEGIYLSQDPIGLKGGNPTIYGYVSDSNTWIDPFGLDCFQKRLGDFGEKWAKEQLEASGKYKKVFSVQNGSGHGIDLVGQRPDGKFDIFEVKTNISGVPGTLSDRQSNAAAFIEDVLGPEKAGSGSFNITPTMAERISNNVGDTRVIDVFVKNGEKGRWFVEKGMMSIW